MLKRGRNLRTGLRRTPPRIPHRRPTLRPTKLPIPAVDHLKSSAAGDPSAALRLLSSSPSLLSYPACSALAYRLARSRLFQHLDQLLLLLRSRRIPCSAFLFSTLIRHFSAASLPDKALQLFFSIPTFNCQHPSPSLHTFNHLLNALVDNGRGAKAKRLLLSGCSEFGLRPNVVSYNIVMKGVLRDDGYDGARKVFDEMRERGVGPSVVSYNMMIGFAGRNGELSKAMALKDEMIRKEIHPNAITYAILMEGLCSSENYAAARKLMFDMEYRGCRTKILNFGVLMSDCGRRGDFDEMKRLLAEMRLRKMKPDDVTYSILVNYLCRSGRVEEAYKMLVEMEVKEGRKPGAAVYRMMVDGFCRVRDFEKGLRVLNAMMVRGHRPRSETFGRLVAGLVGGGRVDEAWFVMGEMEKRKLGFEKGDWSCLVEMICGKCERGIELLSVLSYEVGS